MKQEGLEIGYFMVLHGTVQVIACRGFFVSSSMRRRGPACAPSPLALWRMKTPW